MPKSSSENVDSYSGSRRKDEDCPLFAIGIGIGVLALYNVESLKSTVGKWSPDKTF